MYLFYSSRPEQRTRNRFPLTSTLLFDLDVIGEDFADSPYRIYNWVTTDLANGEHFSTYMIDAISTAAIDDGHVPLYPEVK